MNPWSSDKGKRQQQVDNKIIKPIIFTNKNKIDPFYIMDEHPNDDYRFAILSTTENGRYVVGGMLCFNYKGMDIMTDVNNAIFIDTSANTIVIKDYHKVKEEITPSDPEERQYILLLKLNNPRREEYIWEAMQGRMNAYHFIQDNIDEMEFDPDESFVLVDTVPYKDALSVAGFVRYLKNAELVDINDGFDIDDYCTQ